MPEVDEPVMALASPSAALAEVEEVLKLDDRKLQMLRKAHQTAAWGIKVATAASFFTRASLLWLKQIQDKIPASDIRAHQEFNKIVAAAEFTADATLSSARFGARSIASTVTDRNLLWLRNWQADSKQKWRLASVPFKGSKLFGASLDPLLVEAKDKRKVLPDLSGALIAEPRPPFGSLIFIPTGDRVSTVPRGFTQGQGYQTTQYHQIDLGFPERNRAHPTNKWPFRRGSNCPPPLSPLTSGTGLPLVADWVCTRTNGSRQ